MSDREHAGHPARSWTLTGRALHLLGKQTVSVPVYDIPQTDIHPWWACECPDCEDARRLFTHGHLRQVK